MGLIMAKSTGNYTTSESTVFSVIEEMHEGLQIIDENFCYLYVNKAAARHGESSRDDLIGHSMQECYPGIEETEMFSLLKLTMSDRKKRRMENEFQYPSGEKKWFDLLFEAHERGLLIRSLDITEQKKIEEKYIHAEKMNALGKLAGGIAHEFNNKLGIMQIYCELATKEIPDGQKNLTEFVNYIGDAIRDSTVLTRQLLALSRKQVLELKPMDLNKVITNLKIALGQLLGENIELKYFLAPDLHEIRMDHSQIDQILLNLFINGKDSMPDGGVLTIETFNTHLDEDYCRNHPEVEVGDYVVVSVNDTGTGMDEDTKKRIFEPFFTTKFMGDGTGLGLATVHEIIRQARGHIWVYSEEGIGSTFKIYFPKHKQQSNEVRQTKTETPLGQLTGNETILLAEDDDMLREALTHALQDSGYIVIAANGLEQAVDEFSKQKNIVDLLITDMILKKSKGTHLMEALRKKKPDLKTLFISGYTENTITQHGVLDKDCVLLQKPFSITSLLEVVRKIIDKNLVRGVI